MTHLESSFFVSVVRLCYARVEKTLFVLIKDALVRGNRITSVGAAFRRPFEGIS